jgi:hypothetical protein
MLNNDIVRTAGADTVGPISLFAGSANDRLITDGLQRPVIYSGHDDVSGCSKEGSG